MKSFIGTNGKVAASRCDNFTFCLEIYEIVTLYRTHTERGGQTDITVFLCSCVCYSFNHVYVERSPISAPRDSFYLFCHSYSFLILFSGPFTSFIVAHIPSLFCLSLHASPTKRLYKISVLLGTFIHSLILIYFVMKQKKMLLHNTEKCGSSK